MDLYLVRKQLSMGTSLTDMPLRVVDYARVSTNHQEQKKSLRNQIEHFEKYIKENPNWIYVRSYVDEGITGTSDIKRDNFMKMIEEARGDKFDLIVTKEISRFSRNTLDSIKYTRKLLSYGVAVFFVNDNINTAMPDSELRLTIMASMAQDEIRRLSERVKFGMNRAIERGEILGNDMLYGYKKEKETGKLLIIMEEAKIIRRIYELYGIEKLSLGNIVKILNEENQKTGLGKRWCISTVSRMIENPKYKGYYCGKKTEIVDYMSKKVRYRKKKDWIIYEDKKRIPPIIEEELWERANKRLISRKKAFQKRKEDKSIYKNRYLYSAKIICQEHHKVFHRRLFRKKERDYTWVCSEYLKNGKKSCDSPNIRESELDIIFQDIFSTLQINPEEIVEILMNYYKKIDVHAGIEEQIKRKEKEIDSIHSKKEKLLELSLQGSLSNEEFCERNTNYNEKIKNIAKEMNQLKNTKEKKNLLKELIKELKQKVNATFTFHIMMNLVLDSIVVSKINNSKNKIKLNIFLFDGKNQNLQEVPLFTQKDYEFRRGYDTKKTRRYHVFYQVQCYLNL